MINDCCTVEAHVPGVEQRLCHCRVLLCVCPALVPILIRRCASGFSSPLFFVAPPWIGMYDGNSDCGRSCSCMFGRSDLILGEDPIVR